MHRHPRKLLARLSVALLAALTIACANTRVESRAAPDVDWAGYETVALVASSGTDDAEIAAAIREALGARGLREAADAPDLRVSYRATQSSRTRRRLAPEPDANTYREISVLESTLVIEARDAKDDTVVWTGRGTTPVEDPERSGRLVPEAVEAIFATFPRRPSETAPAASLESPGGAP